MPAVNDPGEGVVVVTTPANPFVAKGMQPGETRTLTRNRSRSTISTIRPTRGTRGP